MREFLNRVLGPNDDITRFEYIQKTNKENGPALVGIELQSKHDYEDLMDRMKQYNIDFTELNKDDILFGYLVYRVEKFFTTNLITVYLKKEFRNCS